MTKMGHSLDAVQYPEEMGGVSYVFHFSGLILPTIFSPHISFSNTPIAETNSPIQGYLAYLESAHQIHCLQAIWEDHHFAKYPELFPLLVQKKKEDPFIDEMHFEHCVDVIRNRLMCTSDSQLVTFRWVEGVSGPYPYFNTEHTCRSYEELLEWDRERSVEKEKMMGYKWDPPKDAVMLKTAP
jgi:hypothetical protein